MPVFTTLESVRHKRGRYEMVNGVLNKFCPECHSFLPVSGFEYNTSLGRHGAYCFTCTQKRITYKQTPEGKREAEKWSRVARERKELMAREPNRVIQKRKHSYYVMIDGEKCKTCTECKYILPLDCFAVNGNGLRSHCKICIAPKQKTYQEKNAEELSVQKKLYYQSHREEAIERCRNWRADNPEQYKTQARNYVRHRLKTDSAFHLLSCLRSRVRDAVKSDKATKSAKTLTLIGCSVEHLRHYIESLWEFGMSWDNYGSCKRDETQTWHIDHIRPCASFDLTDPKQQKLCFHYSNLQPLWAKDNLSKGDSFDPIP